MNSEKRRTTHRIYVVLTVILLGVLGTNAPNAAGQDLGFSARQQNVPTANGVQVGNRGVTGASYLRLQEGFNILNIHGGATGTLTINVEDFFGSPLSSQVFQLPSATPLSLAAADINLDSLTDIAVADGSGFVTLFRNIGAQRFTQVATFDSGGANPSGLAVGAFAPGGLPGIAVTHACNPSDPPCTQPRIINIFTNNGGFVFTATPRSLSATLRAP